MTAPAPAATPAAPRISPVALEQWLRRLVRRAASRPGTTTHPVVLVGAQPVWEGTPEFTIDGVDVRVVACVSPLAVLEQLTLADQRRRDHGVAAPPEAEVPGSPRAAAGTGPVLVLLTDRDGAELGDGVLSQVHRQRVHPIEPWALVEEGFGAAQLDVALTAEDWAAQALVDAMPPGGWPPLPGTVLSRDTALRHLAARRLDPTGRLGLVSDGLDASALLRWSAVPDAVASFAASTGAAERRGLERWLAGQAGAAAEVLFALVGVGRAGDALALGLVCACLWAAEAGSDAGPDAGRARGHVDSHVGRRLGDDVLRAFGDAAHEVVVTMLAEARAAPRPGDAPDTRVHAVLDRAEELLATFGAPGAGRVSDVLRLGFEHRVGAVAAALDACPGAAPAAAPAALAAVAAAAGELRRHHLAGLYRQRVERASMAQRLAHWLHAHTPASLLPDTVAGGIHAHLADGGWVDAALAAVYAGEDVHAGLAAGYDTLYRAVADRRRAVDEAFARCLAQWTAAGTPPGGMLVVESVLERVVAPLVRSGGRKALFVVLDGMSAAVAVQVAEDLRGLRWQEYDPLGGTGGNGVSRRRAAVAALPTVTRTSRMSLLAGRLACGGQDDERAAFERHPLWGGRRARLFHHAGLHGGPGAGLAPDVLEALTGDDELVAVVVNTVDDALEAGREGSDPGWTVDGIGPLRALVDQARAQGRAVVLTSDHGHVVDHGGRKVAASEPLSARHRPDPRPDPRPGGRAESGELGRGGPGEGEVRLAGPRVLTPEGQPGRIIALWDPRLRYTAAKSGYHGGASVAEVTVPVLAFLPFAGGADGVPPDWRPLDPAPAWWSLQAGGEAPAIAAAPGPASPQQATRPAAPSHERSRRALRRPPPEHDGQTALDIPVEPPSAPAARPAQGAPATPGAPPAPAAPQTQAARPVHPAEALVADLLASEVFQAQHRLTPRGLSPRKVAGAVTALLEANGTLATAVVAERAGEHPARAVGFARTLQRLFNLDNYPVLSLIDDERTLRLDVRLLREQFDLGTGA